MSNFDQYVLFWPSVIEKSNPKGPNCSFIIYKLTCLSFADIKKLAGATLMQTNTLFHFITSFTYVWNSSLVIQACCWLLNNQVERTDICSVTSPNSLLLSELSRGKCYSASHYHDWCHSYLLYYYVYIILNQCHYLNPRLFVPNIYLRTNKYIGVLQQGILCHYGPFG